MTIHVLSCLRLSFIVFLYIYLLSNGYCNSSSNRLWVHARCVIILLHYVQYGSVVCDGAEAFDDSESQATNMQKSSVLEILSKPAVVESPVDSAESVGTDVVSDTTTITFDAP